MSAPDRIFAWVYEEGSRRHHVWRRKIGLGGDGQTEYVRADLCDPMQDERVKALVDALRKVIDEYDEFLKDEYMRGLSSLDDEIHDARAALRDIGVKS